MNLLVLFVLGALVLLLVIVALSAIRVVQQYERGVIFVLGRLIGALPGAPLHLAHEQSRLADRHAHGTPARSDHPR